MRTIRAGSGASLVCLLTVMLLMVASASAEAARQLKTGLSLGGSMSDWGFDHAASAHARVLRDTVSWRTTAPSRPSHPRDPADPGYRWSATDEFVKTAANRGFKVLLTVSSTPTWAEGPGKKHARHEGTWKPDAGALGDFAHALARRYSGSFRPAGAGVLPRVRYFEAWTEANLSQLLEPQWENGKPASPGIYRGLANAVSAGVKSVHSSNRVMGPGLAPYGDSRKTPATAGPRMRPVFFLRQLLCLKDRKKLKRKKHCGHPVKLDIVSHHPINSSGAPTRHAIHPDDASSADLHRVMRVVRAAQRKGTIRPKHKHRELGATETWWESKPPSGRGVPPKKQARWLEKALYIFWRDGARVVIQQPLRDGSSGGSGFGGGLFSNNGKPKPAYRAFRFPFLTKRQSKRKITAWGKAPKAGKLLIQRRRGKRWKTVKRLRVRDDQVFKKGLKLRGKAKLRAKVGSTKSLVWTQKK